MVLSCETAGYSDWIYARVNPSIMATVNGEATPLSSAIWVAAELEVKLRLNWASGWKSAPWLKLGVSEGAYLHLWLLMRALSAMPESQINISL